MQLQRANQELTHSSGAYVGGANLDDAWKGRAREGEQATEI